MPVPTWKLKHLKDNRNLRLVTFIIAVLCLAFGIIWLGISSLMAWIVSDRYLTVTNPGGYVYLLRFLLFVFMLIVCCEIVLCLALITGLRKRLPDHLQMWYVGFMLCLGVRTPIAIYVTTKEFYQYNIEWFWLIMIEIIVETLVTLCFIYVVRTYYLRMITETNYYQNLSYAEANMQGKILYSEKPKNDKEEFVYATIGNDTMPVQARNLEKGDLAYPKSAPPLPRKNSMHDKEETTLYPSLDTE